MGKTWHLRWSVRLSVSTRLAHDVCRCSRFNLLYCLESEGVVWIHAEEQHRSAVNPCSTGMCLNFREIARMHHSVCLGFG